MEYDISISFFFFFLGVGAIPLHMKWLSVFPLRIVATVEPNWLENVIDHVLRRICGGQLEQHM